MIYIRTIEFNFSKNQSAYKLRKIFILISIKFETSITYSENDILNLETRIRKYMPHNTFQWRFNFLSTYCKRHQSSIHSHFNPFHPHSWHIYINIRTYNISGSIFSTISVQLQSHLHLKTMIEVLSLFKYLFWLVIVILVSIGAG